MHFIQKCVILWIVITFRSPLAIDHGLNGDWSLLLQLSQYWRWSSRVPSRQYCDVWQCCTILREVLKNWHFPRKDSYSLFQYFIWEEIACRRRRYTSSRHQLKYCNTPSNTAYMSGSISVSAPHSSHIWTTDAFDDDPFGWTFHHSAHLCDVGFNWKLHDLWSRLH